MKFSFLLQAIRNNYIDIVEAIHQKDTGAFSKSITTNIGDITPIFAILYAPRSPEENFYPLFKFMLDKGSDIYFTNGKFFNKSNLITKNFADAILQHNFDGISDQEKIKQEISKSTSRKLNPVDLREKIKCIWLSTLTNGEIKNELESLEEHVKHGGLTIFEDFIYLYDVICNLDKNLENTSIVQDHIEQFIVVLSSMKNYKTDSSFVDVLTCELKHFLSFINKLEAPNEQATLASKSKPQPETKDLLVISRNIVSQNYEADSLAKLQKTINFPKRLDLDGRVQEEIGRIIPSQINMCKRLIQEHLKNNATNKYEANKRKIELALGSS